MLLVSLLALFLHPPGWAANAQFVSPQVTGDIFGLGARTAGPDEIRIYKKDANGKPDRTKKPVFPTQDTRLGADEVPAYHYGIDISSNGRPAEFKAGVYGTVVSAKEGLIVIATADGNYIQFHHNTLSFVKRGETVDPATPLGLTGRIGTGKIHLHIQAKNQRNQLIDPDAAILSARQKPLATSVVPVPPLPANTSVIENLKPVVRDGVLKVSDSAHLYYDENAPKYSATSDQMGGTPQNSNTGNYSKFSKTEADAIPTNLPRSQRIQQNLQQKKALWGGIVLGNAAKKTPVLREAKWKTDGEETSLMIKVQDGDDYVSFLPTNPTELWAAYHFLRPNPELRKQGAKPSDVGFVSVTKHLERGDVDFVIHPAIANTSLAREAMRLDLVLGLHDPSFPLLPRGWRYLQWYDEPGEIKVQGNSILVTPVSDPRTTVLRVRLFLEDTHDNLDATTLEHLYQKMDAFRKIDRFARTLAVLTWLDSAGKLPNLPPGVQPEKFNVPNQWNLRDVLLGSRTQVHGWLPKEERSKSHLVFLEKGRKYRIDLESHYFHTYLTLEDKAGNTLGENDHGGVGTNAHLDFTPPRTDQYRVVVSAFQDKGRGGFRLTVKQLADSWVGQTILTTKTDVRIGFTDDAGRQVYLATLEAKPYKVLGEQEGWIQVATPKGVKGWFDKADAVLAEDALDLFTDRMNRDPKDAFAIGSRIRILATPYQ